MTSRRLLSVLALAAVALVALTLTVPQAGATGSNNPHKVWVCKYRGKPGNFEILKAGKQPIQVSASAADDHVGADFADGQFHSVVIDLVTKANTDEHNNYVGTASCPRPPAATTTAAPGQTTTTQPGVTTTTQPEATTTTAPGETTTSFDGSATRRSRATPTTVCTEARGCCVQDCGPTDLPRTGGATGVLGIVGLLSLLGGSAALAHARRKIRR